MARKRIAIIGLGMAVTPHAQSLLDLGDRVEVAAAHSPTEARRAAFAARWGFPATADINAIFTDRSIDAVMVLTPPNTHLELTQRAAEAGKHVLLEKPLEITLERAQALVDVADTAGITLGIVLQHRFRPASMALARLIEEGRLGGLVSTAVQARNWRPQSYYDQPGRGTRARDGGGVLITQAIHTLDLAISLAGLPVEVSAYAATSPIHRMETEDIAAAAVRYTNGAIGTIAATTTAFPGFPEAVEIVGSKGTARLEGAETHRRLPRRFTLRSRRRERRWRHRRGSDGVLARASSRGAHGFPGRPGSRRAAAHQRQGGAEGASPDRGDPALFRSGPARAGLASAAADRCHPYE